MEPYLKEEDGWVAKNVRRLLERKGGGASRGKGAEPIFSQRFSSWAIFDAIFLNPIDVPEIRLNRTPFRLSRGSLHTSISH